VRRYDDRLELPVSNSRNILALAVLLPLTGLALYVAVDQREQLDATYWWILVFPVLTLATAYRLVRRRVPLAMDPEGLDVRIGMPVLGLATRIPWRSVRRIRVTAAGMLLVDMKDWEGFSETRGWRVFANMRANQRKAGAPISQPLRALAGRPQDIVGAVQSVAPVPVDAPQALKAPATGRG